MFELLRKEDLAYLENREGVLQGRIIIPALPPGTIIRADTRSGGRYFFEIVEPEKCLAYVVRSQAGPSGLRTGLLPGKREVSRVFVENRGIVHGAPDGSEVSHTSVVRRLLSIR